MPSRKRVKVERKICSYCGLPRAKRLFKDGEDTCYYCLVFDRAAKLTAPKG